MDWSPIGKLVEPVQTWNPLKADPNSTFKYIDLSAVDQCEKVITEVRLLQAREAPSRARQLVKTSDILISTVRPNLNGVASVPPELDGATASTGFCVLRPIKDSLDSKYLFQWVKSKHFVDNMTHKATGASYPAVSDRIVQASLIPCPLISEQRRIAAILDQAEALIGARQDALTQLDNLAQSIFIEMFGSPTINPKNWQVCPVGKVTDCIVPGRDKPKSFSGTTPWITTDDLLHLNVTSQSPKFLGLSPDEISEVRARIIPKGSVIISCVGNLGVTSIAGEDMVINQQLHSFQCHREMNNVFLMYSLSFQKAFMYAKASSTTLPYMNKSICNSIPVLMPPIDLQIKFASCIASIGKQKAVYQSALIGHRELFASLQYQAFRGGL